MQRGKVRLQIMGGWGFSTLEASQCAEQERKRCRCQSKRYGKLHDIERPMSAGKCGASPVAAVGYQTALSYGHAVKPAKSNGQPNQKASVFPAQSPWFIIALGGKHMVGPLCRIPYS